MEHETDGSLFTFLQFFDTDPTEANAALQEIMRRYEAILTRRCSGICGRFPSLGYTGRELADETFWKATQRAETYVPLDRVDATQTDHQKYTAAWLFRIAQRLLFDVHRQANRPVPYDRDIPDPQPIAVEEIVAALIKRHPDRFSVATKGSIALAFESLNETSKMILTWTVSMRERSPGGDQMVRGSAKKLASRLGTTVANVRQIRKRAIDKMEKAVQRSGAMPGKSA